MLDAPVCGTLSSDTCVPACRGAEDARSSVHRACGAVIQARGS